MPGGVHGRRVRVEQGDDSVGDPSSSERLDSLHEGAGIGLLLVTEVGEPNVAVCLLPGTEIAFDRDVNYYDPVSFPTVKVAQKVARFRQVEKDKPHVHHDALEFPDGQIVLLTALCEGQHATVLQLPAMAQPAEEAAGHEPAAEQTIESPALAV